MPVKVKMDEPPTMQELTKAIEKVKGGKAAEVDGIPLKLWINGGPALHSKLHELLVCCWKQSKMPEDLRNKSLLPYSKIKGKSLTALTTVGSLYSPLQAKSLLVCS